MILSPNALRQVILSQLTDDEKSQALGTFSRNELPQGYDKSSPTNPINMWFQRNVTTEQRAMILQHPSIAALLIISADGYQLVSKPTVQMDPRNINGETTIVGHFGDTLDTMTPVALNLTKATSNLYALLPEDDAENQLLSHLKTTGPAAGATIPAPNEGEDDITFFSRLPLYPHEDLPSVEGLRIARLPVTVPLPHGHNITPIETSPPDGGLEAMNNRLEELNPKLSLWFQAMNLSGSDTFHGRSLHDDLLHIHEDYFQGQQDETGCPYAYSMYTVLRPLGTLDADVTERLKLDFTTYQRENIDSWCTANKERYTELTRTLTPHPPAPAPAPAPTATPTIMAPLSKTDQSAQARYERSLGVYKVLLGKKELDTNGNAILDEQGNPIIVPATINPDLDNFLKESSPRNNLVALQTSFHAHLESHGQTTSLLQRDVDLDPMVITTRFAASWHIAALSQHPLKESMSQTDRLLSIMALLRHYKPSDEMKAARERDNDVRDEHAWGETGTTATKGDTKIDNSGAQKTYRDVYTALANAHAFFSYFLHPNENPNQSFLLNAISRLHNTVRNKNFETWFDHHLHGQSKAYWLAHSHISDAHNVICNAAKIALNQASITSVLQNEPVNGKDIATFEQTLTFVVNKWNTGYLTDSLSVFSAPPSTVPAAITAQYTKQDANKRQKKDHPNDRQPNGQQPRQDQRRNSFGDFRGNHTRNGGSGNGTGNTGSDPNRGFLLVEPPNAPIRSQPNLPRGRVPCLDFTAKGRSCSNGANCSYAHVTPNTIRAEEVSAYDDWIDSTPNLSYAYAPEGSRFYRAPQEQQEQQQQQQQQQQRQNTGNRNSTNNRNGGNNRNPGSNRNGGSNNNSG